MIRFEECRKSGYAARTDENASLAQATIAVAAKFNTAGERLTRECAHSHCRSYVPIKIGDSFNGVVAALKGQHITHLNFAGNGIYTMAKSKWTQEMCDAYALEILKVVYAAHPELILVRSGGQTGFDEAGVKAAEKLGIDALVLAPRGWLFRDINGEDFRGKDAFTRRFLS